MLHPSYLEIREQVTDNEAEKDLNRYSLIIGVAKRARQIIEEENLRAKYEDSDISIKANKEYKVKPVTQAVNEVYRQEVHILEEDTDELY